MLHRPRSDPAYASPLLSMQHRRRISRKKIQKQKQQRWRIRRKQQNNNRSNKAIKPNEQHMVIKSEVNKHSMRTLYMTRKVRETGSLQRSELYSSTSPSSWRRMRDTANANAAEGYSMKPTRQFQVTFRGNACFCPTEQALINSDGFL